MSTHSKGQPMYPCPACGQSTTWQENPHRPFCSERCKMIDLGKWAMEEYRIPGKPVDPEQALEAEQRRTDNSPLTKKS